MAGWGVEVEGLDGATTMLDNVAVEYGTIRSYTVKSNVDYAVYVEFGTGPHIIESDGDSPLAFEAGGEVVFTHRVRHPGTEPNGALRKAVKVAMANLDTIAAGAESPAEITKAIAEFIRDGWKRDVWVDEGTLRESIHVEEL